MSEITRNQLWDMIATFKQDKDRLLDWICDTLGGVKKNRFVTQRVSNELVKFKKAKEIQRKRRSTERSSVQPPENTIIFDPYCSELEKIVPEEQPPMEVDNEEQHETSKSSSSTKQRKSSGSGRSVKPFSSLSSGGKRRRTDKLYAMCLQAVDEENAGKSDEEYTMNKLLGYLLRRFNYHSNPKVADIGYKLEENKPIDQGDFDVNEAITLSLQLNLSKEQQQVFKNWMAKVNVNFPCSKIMLKTRRQMKPDISPLSVFEENPSQIFSGVSVSYRDLILKTDGSIFDVINFRDPEILPQYQQFKAVYKDGSDGSGSQAVMQTPDLYKAAENIYAHSIVPLRMDGIKIDGTSDTLWRNRAPNAANGCRPTSLIRSKETTEVVQYDVKYVEREINKLHEESYAVVSFRNPDTAYQVQHEIKSTMKDLKMKKIQNGLGGADCILCETKQAEWMNVKAIEQGFAITRTVEKIKDIWDMMVQDEQDNRKTDSVTRKGVTKESITEHNQYSICITHTYINCCNWFVKVLARLNAEDLTWIEKSNCYGDHIREGTKRVKKAIWKYEGKRIDEVNSSVAKTGGSTTGEVGRAFFSKEFLPTILELVLPKYQEDVSTLHKNLSAIFRIISCTKKVDMVKYEALILETSLHIAKKFPWIQINYTLHGSLHHSAELIGMNNETGLGEWSEEALEANNKFIRRFAETRSRKFSANAQLTDVIGLLIERSCPFTLEMQQMIRPAKEACLTCGSKKHTTRSHERRVNDYDDSLFNEIIVME